MRKTLLVSMFLLLNVLPAAAQFTLVTGTVKDVNGLAYAGGTISAQLVVPGGASPTLNGVSFTGSMSPIGLDLTGSFTARLADNNVVLPSGTQWKFQVNITGAPPPLGTGPQTCVATVTITGASQSISASFSACPALSNTGVGGTTVAPNAPAWYFSPNCGTQTNCTTIKDYAAIMNDVSATNGSSVITCPSNDCNFVASDVGAVAWVTTQIVGNPNTTFVCPETTILSVNSAQSITLAAANDCTSTVVGTGALLFGFKEGSAISSVMNSTCTGFFFPSMSARPGGPGNYFGAGAKGALMLIDQPMGISASGCADSIVFGGGQNYLTGFLIPPDYNWTGCTGVAGSFTGICNGSNVQTWRDVTFTGGGVTGGAACPAAAQNKTFLTTDASAGWIHGTDLAGICLDTPGLIGQLFNNLDGSSQWGGAQDVGQYACVSAALGTAMFFNDCDNSDSSSATTYGLWVKSGAQFQDFGTFKISATLVNGTAQFRNTHFVGNHNNAGAENAITCSGAGSRVLSDGDFINAAADSPQTSNHGVNVQNGCVFSARNTQFNATGSTSFFPVLLSSLGPPNVFIDQGGNTFAGGYGQPENQNDTATNVFQGLGALLGSCSGTATSSSTLGLYHLGQFSAATCTSTTVNLGQVQSQSGTAYGLFVTATHAGVSASSGVVTVLKNGVATTQTCTIGTGTACKDSAHPFSFVVGDVISVQFTTQAAEVLAGVSANVFVQR